MKKNRKINKKEFKQKHSQCAICEENRVECLEVHRIIFGKDEGKYTDHNSICLCASCHNYLHHDKIKIIGKFDSTKGSVLIYIDDNGKEIIKPL